MRNIVHKFLDKYAGDNLEARKSIGEDEFYSLYSSHGSSIMTIGVLPFNKTIVIKNLGLCKTLSSFFSITKDESTEHIQKWLGEKHNLHNINDIIEFCKEHYNDVK
jgi:hypothetical protein